MLTLYTMRKITRGTLHTFGLISLRSTENSQTGRIIFVVLCPHYGKGNFVSHFSLNDQLYETVINMFVLRNEHDHDQLQ